MVNVYTFKEVFNFSFVCKHLSTVNNPYPIFCILLLKRWQNKEPCHTYLHLTPYLDFEQAMVVSQLTL